MDLPLRTRVRVVDASLFGYRERKELEGKEGVVMPNDPRSQYVRVKIVGGNAMLFKPSEIEVIS